MLKFNLNNYVVVQLKPKGEQILLDYWNQYQKDYPHVKGTTLQQLREWKHEKNGYWTFQMHAFMNVFGDHLHNGFDTPIWLDVYFYETEMETVDDPRTAV